MATSSSDERNEIDSEPEDILSTSLETLYGYSPITHSAAGALFTYTSEASDGAVVSLRTPDTSSANWSLHAPSIWVAAIFLADHLPDLGLHERNDLRILELGAAAGLPGILIAKLHHGVRVTVSDYPDDQLIATLRANIERNDVGDRCRAVAYAWGSDVSSLSCGADADDGYDIVLAADTLWNSEFHAPFLQSLRMTLRRTADARVHLVAGLHTGRYTIQAFLDAAEKAGFHVASITERKVGDDDVRVPWDVTRADDERERRGWVVWISLRWP
ncbi:hypothetical protein PLICRDRAFT_42968 [Plicaturopsis crispa FD-325 SS-3]|nr:hypothetical protein PLICRDRAFT_42968 [Plicaturopsis crispa FD-325 SS-3]